MAEYYKEMEEDQQGVDFSKCLININAITVNLQIRNSVHYVISGCVHPAVKIILIESKTL